MGDPFATKALALLHRLTGDDQNDFRDDQLEVILGLVGDRGRFFLVQRTGWGKSAVYFIATRMLRDLGAGPTLLVSPLIALMRNQLKGAERAGIRAATINNENYEEWKEVEEHLESDDIDLLLISPERLSNPRFRSHILRRVGRGSGLLVIDEAHCISDWGHTFRPEYRRIVRVLDLLPAGVPVLCSTATANDRVANDVMTQLGPDLVPIRGPLGRDGLQLAVLKVPQQSTRLAWLAEQIPKLPGAGIVYCLRVADTERVAEWLRVNKIDVKAYYGDIDMEEKVAIEEALVSNEVKAVVATSALGMGFDKPDLAFVIHYQSPGSPIVYYQQVGRAGRGIAKSWGVLLSGAEDAGIQDYFIHSALSSPDTAAQVVSFLEERSRQTTASKILESVNVRESELEQVLRNLEVEGVVKRKGDRWLRTLKRWEVNDTRAQAVTKLRRAEQDQMNQYINSMDCRMRLLRGFLDDATDEPCGVCDNCSDIGLVAMPSPSEVQRAVDYLRSAELGIEPQRELPNGEEIAANQRLEVGRALSRWGDGEWSSLVRHGKQIEGRFDERLVVAAADLIRARWCPEPAPTWVTYVPSPRNRALIADFAERLSASLGLPCQDVVVKVRETEPQKTMQNSQQQYTNVRGTFELRGPVPSGAVLLVDDMVDSKWTMTAIGWKLRAAGVSHVYPFALTDTAGRSVT